MTDKWEGRFYLMIGVSLELAAFLVGFIIFSACSDMDMRELGNAICSEQNIYEYNEIYVFNEVLNNGELVKQRGKLIQEFVFDTYSDGILKCKPSPPLVKEVKYDGIKVQIKGEMR